jgi:hypothetical protein
MFGWNKLFVIFLFLALIVGRYMGWENGLGVIILYILGRIAWKIFT